MAHTPPYPPAPSAWPSKFQPTGSPLPGFKKHDFRALFFFIKRSILIINVPIIRIISQEPRSGGAMRPPARPRDRLGLLAATHLGFRSAQDQTKHDKCLLSEVKLGGVPKNRVFLFKFVLRANLNTTNPGSIDWSSFFRVFQENTKFLTETQEKLGINLWTGALLDGANPALFN